MKHLADLINEMGLSEGGEGGPLGGEGGELGDMGELGNLLSELEKGAGASGEGGPALDGFFEKFMDQLISKEILYAPMCDMRSKV